MRHRHPVLGQAPIPLEAISQLEEGVWVVEELIEPFVAFDSKRLRELEHVLFEFAIQPFESKRVGHHGI